MAATTASVLKESFAVKFDPDANVPINQVQIDALAVLRIIKHSRESFPTSVTGALLGLDIRGTLEVTHSYPNLSKKDDEDMDQDLYQIETLKCLRAVNVDSNTVGWYQSAPLGSFWNSQCVNSQKDYQLSIGQSVVIEYDPVRSSRAHLSLRAFQLTPTFLQLYKQKGDSNYLQITSESIARLGLSYSQIFQEIPIQVKNSHLLSALIAELETSPISSSLQAPIPECPLPMPLHPNFDQLEGPLNGYLEKNVESIIESLDEYHTDQQRYQYWLRNYQREKSKIEMVINKKRQDPNNKENLDVLMNSMLSRLPSEPNRLESMLSMAQIKQYCSQVNSYSAPALSRLYANGALMKNQ